MPDTFSSLDKQIAEIEAHLRTIDERLAEFVSPSDPANLQLVHNRKKLEAQLADLHARRDRLSQPQAPGESDHDRGPEARPGGRCSVQLVVAFAIVALVLILVVPFYSISASVIAALFPRSPTVLPTTPQLSPTIMASPTPSVTPAPTATWTPTTLSTATPSATSSPTASTTISPPPSPTYGPYFNVYTDGDAPDNHFTPTNYMGDLGDITINENWRSDSDPAHSSVIKIIYDPRGRGDDKGIHTCIRNEPTSSICRWAGVFWTHPENNWGEMPGVGYDLTGFTKLTFWARRDEQPVVAQFQVGGIGRGIPTPPPYPDSIGGPVKAGWRPLNTEWTHYEIGLTGQNLNYVVGGFAWIISWANAAISAVTPPAVNPPLVFYLDDIRFER